MEMKSTGLIDRVLQNRIVRATALVGFLGISVAACSSEPTYEARVETTPTTTTEDAPASSAQKEADKMPHVACEHTGEKWESVVTKEGDLSYASKFKCAESLSPLGAVAANTVITFSGEYGEDSGFTCFSVGVYDEHNKPTTTVNASKRYSDILVLCADLA